MKIKQDFFQVARGVRDERGDLLEPEQQPAVRVVTTDAPASGHGTGEHLGSMPAAIEVHDHAQSFAQRMRSLCATCVHFNNKAWQRLKQHWETTNEGEQILNGMRAALMETGNVAMHDMMTAEDGDIDVEHGLSMCGVCEPQTEEFSALENEPSPVIVYPLGCCPPEKEFMYTPVDTDHEKVGASAFDRIMFAAAGKPK